MDATAPFDVIPAVAATGQDMPGGGVTLSISIDGQLALDGDAQDRSTLLDSLSVRIADDSSQLIRVNAHHSAALSNLLPLVAAIEAMGAKDVVLVVTPQTP
jgi:biopolymer transport protein ExbD